MVEVTPDESEQALTRNGAANSDKAADIDGGTSGPTILAHIGVKRALNRHVAIIYDPDLKMPHWRKRKPKRDL